MIVKSFFDISGKIAVITGGTGGLGIELAKGFWYIFIIGRHPAQFRHWYSEWWKPLNWD